MCRAARLVGSVFVVFEGLLGSAESVAAQPAPPCLASDFVGVAVVDRAVILATPARRTARDSVGSVLTRFEKYRGDLWRFRAIPYDEQVQTRPTVRLRQSGAFAEVAFGSGQTRLVDLTRDVLILRESDTSDALALPDDAPRPCTLPPSAQARLPVQFDEFMAVRAGDASDVTAVNAAWSFFQVAVRPELYAPALQLSNQENILPEDFDIWKRLGQAPGQGRSKLSTDLGVASRTGPEQSRRLKLLYRIYRTDVAHRDEAATVYLRVLSLDGSWVVQYWLYYPIDEGGLDEHLHDSEHLFVEVDKLGGIVRRVVGAGHGNWAPNNEYGTFSPGAPPVTRPLWAIVERGKHATAPDIDRDGRFVPGVDSNLYRDAGKVWGIRDATGQTDSLLRAYAGEMLAGRVRRLEIHSIVAADAPAPACASPAQTGPTCYVLRPITNMQRAACGPDLADCARQKIVGHPDFRRSYAILKEGFFPTVALRLGLSRTPTTNSDTARRTENSWRIVAGASFEISAIPSGNGKRLPLPGRVAIDTVWDNLGEPGRFDGIAGRYETMVSNLFNAYIGMTRQTDELDELPALDPEDPGRSLWLTAGAGFERPVKGRLTFSTQAGLLFNNFYGLRFEWRAGMGLAFAGGNRRFGIPWRLPNPFSH